MDADHSSTDAHDSGGWKLFRQRVLCRDHQHESAEPAGDTRGSKKRVTALFGPVIIPLRD